MLLVKFEVSRVTVASSREVLTDVMSCNEKAVNTIKNGLRENSGVSACSPRRVVSPDKISKVWSSCSVFWRGSDKRNVV